MFLKIDVDNYHIRRPVVLADGSIQKQIFTRNEYATINGFKTLKKQLEWMCGRFCVKHILLEKFNLPMNTTEIQYEPEGAPFLTSDPERYISITHSGKFAGAAVSIHRNKKCGLDLEQTDRNNMTTFTKVAFTEREIQSSKTDLEIYTVWTVKEAYLKYIRKGFHKNLKSVEFFGNILYDCGRKQDIIIQTKQLDKNHLFTIIT